MIVGFNHNISYRGVGFHVQTEDSGVKNPHLVTLLYHGGIIVSCQKTSYQDLLGCDALDHVIEEMAKEQHKGMLRRLTQGEFDQRIAALKIELVGAPSAAKKAPQPSSHPEPVAFAPVVAPVIEPQADNEDVTPAAKAKPAEPEAVEMVVDVDPSLALSPATDAQPLPEPHVDYGSALDDLIFAYLTAGDGKG